MIFFLIFYCGIKYFVLICHSARLVNGYPNRFFAKLNKKVGLGEIFFFCNLLRIKRVVKKCEKSLKKVFQIIW